MTFSTIRSAMNLFNYFKSARSKNVFSNILLIFNLKGFLRKQQYPPLICAAAAFMCITKQLKIKQMKYAGFLSEFSPSAPKFTHTSPGSELLFPLTRPNSTPSFPTQTCKRSIFLICCILLLI